MKTYLNILLSLIVSINIAMGEILIDEELFNFSPIDTNMVVFDNSVDKNYVVAISEILGSNIAIWYFSYSTMNSSGDFNISVMLPKIKTIK